MLNRNLEGIQTKADLVDCPHLSSQLDQLLCSQCAGHTAHLPIDTDQDAKMQRH